MGQVLKLLSGPVAFALIMVLASLHGFPAYVMMAAVTVWVALWWFTEATALAITALLPFVLIPLLGIADAKTIAMQYMDQVIFLFIGGFMLSYALEKCQLHTRLAYFILSRVGTSPVRMLAGMMAVAFFISMWMSNTATVMMLYAAVNAVILQFKSQEDQHRKFGAALMIGLAYAASIGGMSTLVGTPTNMIFYSYYADHYPGGHPITFLHWFFMAFPVAALLCYFTFLLIKNHFKLSVMEAPGEQFYFSNQYKALGPLSKDERNVALVFLATILLWFTRTDMDLGNFYFIGWASRLQLSDHVQDSTVAVMMGLLLCLIPSRKESGKMLLDWSDCKKLPLEIILLFGSGFALAKGFELSGLSKYIATSLHYFNNLPPVLLVLGIGLIITLISEFASNVASIQLALPIISALALSLQIPALYLLIPATLSASMGFMLPVATAPNSIVYGSGLIQSADMFRIGWWVNVLGVVLITFCMLLLYPLVFPG